MAWPFQGMPGFVQAHQIWDRCPDSQITRQCNRNPNIILNLLFLKRITGGVVLRQESWPLGFGPLIPPLGTRYWVGRPIVKLGITPTYMQNNSHLKLHIHETFCRFRRKLELPQWTPSHPNAKPQKKKQRLNYKESLLMSFSFQDSLYSQSNEFSGVSYSVALRTQACSIFSDTCMSKGCFVIYTMLMS